jgi:hypothetical protein
MKWYMPSWNGDVRIESDPDNSSRTLLWIEKPTDYELQVLARLSELLLAAGHIQKKFDMPRCRPGFAKKKPQPIDAPVATIGPLVAKLFKPGDAVLTAVKLKDGQLITCTGTGADLVELIADVADVKKPEDSPKKAKAAVTVKRPTPSCPQCIPGSVEPARQVLLEFLNPGEHEQWSNSRTLFVTGGLSGHRYLIAHRNTRAAARIGRIAFDIDAQCVVHFHDRSVPPEEEVLAAKLILEHREPWLRNEATMLGASSNVLVFKNPFGDGNDGIPDAGLTSRIGSAVLQAIAKGD